MSNTLILLTSFSIVIPALIGWVRFSRIDPVYYPFIICIWIGLLNELISLIIISYHYYNTVNSNIYVLLESILVLWQFKRWGTFDRRKYLFPGLLTLFACVWIGENFFISRITSFSSYFRITYSAVICLASIHHMNWVILQERDSLLRNSAFLICAGFIIYYTYKVLIEAFWVYGLNNSRVFRMNVYLIMAYINLLVNLIYGFAVIWIPTKQRFTLPY